MEHEAALNDIFGDLTEAPLQSPPENADAVRALSSSIKETSQVAATIGDEDNVFDELERELDDSASAALQANALQTPLKSGPNGGDSLVDQLDELLQITPAAARPSSSVLLTPAADTPVSPRPALPSPSPLESALAAAALQLPSALAPALSSMAPWGQEHLDRLGALLDSGDSSGVAGLCLLHRSIPSRHRAAIWALVLGLVAPPASPPTPAVIDQASGSQASGSIGHGSEDAVSGEGPLSPQPRHTRLPSDSALLAEQIQGDLTRVMGGEPGVLPLLSVDALSRVVSSFCTTRMVPYSPTLAALAAPLAYVTGDSAVAFLLLYAWVQTFFPHYFSLSVEGWARVSSPSGQEAPVQGHPSVSYTHGLALHALVAYAEPELACAMDSACPAWWAAAQEEQGGTSTPSTPVNTLQEQSLAGAVPLAWFGSLFSGIRGVKPSSILPLWDRFLLSAYALMKERAGWASLSMDVQAFPLTPGGVALVGLAASLVLRESVSLRVVCRTVGRAGSVGGGAGGGMSVKERVSAAEVGDVSHGMPSARPSQARSLMASALEGGLKRLLKQAKEKKSVGDREGGGVGGDKEEEQAVGATFAWLSSAASLLSSTPQSFGTSPLIDPSAPMSPHEIGSAGGLRLSPAEVLPQVVYGWQRILAAAGSVPPSVRAAVLQPHCRSALLPCTALPIRPVHVLVLDVRPASHRRAGRLATAYHIDASSVVLPESVDPSWSSGEAVEDEVAGAAAPVGRELLSPGGSSSDGQPTPPLSSSHLESTCWGVRGVPLTTVLAELKQLNGRLHFVVAGVGVRVIRGAYPHGSVQACAALDDARVAAVVRALRAAGLRSVSALEGGFGGIHGGVRNKAMHAPPLLPALRPNGSYTSALSLAAPSTSSSTAAQGGQVRSPVATEAVYDISLFVAADDALTSLKSCLVDHVPRACPSCRHAAVARLFDRTLALAGAGMVGVGSPPGCGGVKRGAGTVASASPAAASTGVPYQYQAMPDIGSLARAAGTLFDGLADSAAAAVQSLRDDLGVQPSTLHIPTLPAPTFRGASNGHAAAAAAPGAGALAGSVADATDAALSSILMVVRSGGMSARVGLATLAQDIAAAASAAADKAFKPSDAPVAAAPATIGLPPAGDLSSREGGGPNTPGADAFAIGEEEGEGCEGGTLAGEVVDKDEEEGEEGEDGDEAEEEVGGTRAQRVRERMHARIEGMQRLRSAASVQAREQAAKAKEGAGKAREQALAAANSAKSVIARALAPPLAANPSAPSTSPNLAAALAAAGRSIKAGLTAPPPGGTALSASVPSPSPHTVPGAGVSTSNVAPSGISSRWAGMGSLAGGLAQGLAGRAAEGLKSIASAGEKAVAQVKVQSRERAPSQTAPPPLPLQVVLPHMDPRDARLLSGSAKGEEIDLADGRWASGILTWQCSKEKELGGGGGDSAPPLFLPRVLCLAPTAGRLLVLQADTEGKGKGWVKSNHHVTELGKLSYSRKRPNRVTLWYRRATPHGPLETEGGGGGVELVPRVYVLEGAETRPDGSIVPAGEAFAAALQATVSKIKRGN